MSYLSVAHLEKSFGSTRVLRDVSFDLPEGETLSVIGSSGSGKTTLLRCLNFLERPDAGVISLRDQTLLDGSRPPVRERELREKRLHFGLVFQDFNLFPQYTALENVTLARRLAKLPGESEADIRDRGLALLEQMGLSDRAGHYPHQLSGGQKQRVAIARALCMVPDAYTEVSGSCWHRSTGSWCRTGIVSLRPLTGIYRMRSLLCSQSARTLCRRQRLPCPVIITGSNCFSNA